MLGRSSQSGMWRFCVLVAVLGTAQGQESLGLDAKCVTSQCRDAAGEVLGCLDMSSDPCHDFYHYACGHFNSSHVLPPGKLLWDYYQILQEAMDNTSRGLLEQPELPGDAETVVKAKLMYAACMNTDVLDKRGLIPIEELLDEWGGWPLLNPDWLGSRPDWGYLADVIAEFAVPFLFSITCTASLDNANTTALYVTSPTLGLPTPLHPLQVQPDIMQELSRAGGAVEDLPFTKYLVRVATLLRDHQHSNVSDEEILKDVMDVILFMQELSSAMTRQGLGRAEDLEKSKAWTVEQLQNWTNSQLGNITTLDWLDFLQRTLSKSEAEVTSESLVIGADGVAKIVQVVEKADPRVLRNYVISRLLVFLAPETSTEMRQAFKEFYMQMGYMEENYPRWLYCLHKVEDYPSIGFSHAIAYELRKTFDTRKIEEAEQMVADLMSAFHELLAENDWMDDETRQKAAEKTDAMFVLIGFPSITDTSVSLDEFYNKMNVSIDDHFGNVKRLRSFGQAKNLASLGKPRNRNEWTQSPLVVNAFYNSLNNRITFPVGMMSDPFFSGDERERSFDYGRIGAIVGHEITHGFDNMGRLYDKLGTASNWWTPQTEAKFEERAQCFVQQYNYFNLPEINATVDGSVTLRENIADNGGVREAYRAYKRAESRGSVPRTPRLPGLEDFSPNQLFFLGFATMWCRAETVEGLLEMQGEAHSANRYRVIGSLSNMAEFSEAFSCPMGSNMNPENKCVLW